MQDVAPAALAGGTSASGPDPGAVVLARVVKLQGFGSRRVDQAALFDRGGPVGGALLGGAADAMIAAAAHPGVCEVLGIEIADDPAVQAGLACGGRAEVLVQDLQLVPRRWWEAVAGREPVALVTSLATGHSRVVEAATADPVADRISLGRTSVDIEGEEAIEVWWPTPTMLVLGSADLAGVLARQAELLGWSLTLIDTPGPASPSADARAAAAALGPADALVVLSHDHDWATPVLAAALVGRAGYVGALGSRHTQGERRARLVAAGVEGRVVDRLHGPVGLDIGARSPEEQALSIFAEVVAARSGRSARALPRHDRADQRLMPPSRPDGSRAGGRGTRSAVISELRRFCDVVVWGEPWDYEDDDCDIDPVAS